MNEKKKDENACIQAVSLEAADWRDGKVEPAAVQVPHEAAIRVEDGGELLATLHCSPGNLDDLVRGFLLGEGFAGAADDIHSLDIDGKAGVVSVELAGGAKGSGKGQGVVI